MKKILTVLLVLSILTLSACGTAKPQIIEWPDTHLGNMLPRVEGAKGEVNIYSNSLSITLVDTTLTQFNDYVSQCKENGFCVDAKEESESYSAYNENGYALRVVLYDDNDMDITIKMPIEMSDFEWPKSALAKTAPSPDSTYGKITSESDTYFHVYVGNMSKEDYKNYVNKVYDAGFTIDYYKSENVFYADNAEGYHVNVDFKGFNTVSIEISAPDDDEENENNTSVNENVGNPDDSVQNDTNSNSNNNSNNNNSSSNDTNDNNNNNSEELVNGMRPSFKEAMDSYEKFFDEYCEFMKKYNNSSDTTSLLNDYLTFLARYAEVSAKMEKLGDEDLNDVELNYYIQVTGRINEKLLELS